MKKFNRIIVGFVIIAAIVCSGLGIYEQLPAHAATPITGTQALLNATNTFDVDESSFDSSGNIITTTQEYRKTNKTQYLFQYNMGARNNLKDYVSDVAQITVLTPGMNSRAGVWSNNFTPEKNQDLFCYQKDSIISKISEAADGAHIYWVRMDNLSKYSIYDLSEPKIGLERVPENYEIINEAQDYKPNPNLKKVEHIEDISKHIIIAFEAFNRSGSNANDYWQFNYAISNVINDVKLLNGGLLPKLNLIAHSRGGLTNVQYAMDHPDLVESMVSLGTPYLGSTSAKCFGKLVVGDCDALDDIVDPGIYYAYSQRWNEGYEALYKNIDVLAYGAYINGAFFDGFAMNSANMLGKLGSVGLGALLKMLNTYMFVNNCMPSNMDVFLERIGHDFAQYGIENLAEINWLEFGWDAQYPWTCWYNDMLVPLDSQHGRDTGTNPNETSYKGFKNFTRKYTDTNIDFGKPAQANFPVAHNLETQDSLIITDAIHFLTFGIDTDGAFSLTTNADQTASITGYKGKIDTSSFSVPSNISGYTITGIKQAAFADNFKGNNVTNVTIPSTIKFIEEQAFARCDQLNSITIPNGSQLIKLGSGAFENCKNLRNVVLPDSLTEIGEGTFSGCSSFTSFTIGSNVDTIGKGAFANCNKLSTFSVNANNRSWTQSDGVLFTREMTKLVLYPNGKTNTTYTVPATVNEIYSFAFSGNTSLAKIDLNNVETIREGAFYNAAALTSITGTKLTYAENAITTGTPWEKAQTGDYVGIGKVLLKYQGTSETPDLSLYNSISAFAFSSNKTIRSITLGNFMQNIGDAAFYGCTGLTQVTIANLSNFIYIGQFVFDGNAETRKILLPAHLLSSYKNDELWNKYSTDFSVPATTLHFDSAGGNICEDIQVLYGAALGELPVPVKKHYDFSGWYFEQSIVTSAHIWNQLVGNATLTAHWTPITYSVQFFDTGDSVVPSYTYTVESTTKPLPIPARSGYTFAGWYSTAEHTGTPITTIQKGSGSNLSLYAKWTSNHYSVALNSNYEGAQNSTMPIMFGTDYNLGVPIRTGYDFNGWKNAKGVLFTNENGDSLQPWNIADNDTVLYASWSAKNYVVKIVYKDTDNAYVICWLGSDGLSDTETGIPYGTEFASTDALKNALAGKNMRPGSYLEKFLYNNNDFNFWGEMPDIGESGTLLEIIADYRKEECTVCYLNEPIDGIKVPLVADCGTSISLLEKSKPGYTFQGWYVANIEKNRRFDGTQFQIGTRFDYTKMPDLSPTFELTGVQIYVEARFSENLIPVTFSNTKGQSFPTQYIKFDTNDYRLPVPECNGWEFLGWFDNLDEIGSSYADADGIATRVWDKTSATILYGAWKEQIFNITYVLNGGINGGNPGSYTINSINIDLKDAVKKDHAFVGWYEKPDFSGTIICSIPKGSAKHFTLYAKFLQLYTLTFNTLGGDYVDNIQSVSGRTIILPSTELRGFNGVWNINSKSYTFGSSYFVSPPSEGTEIIFTATWTERPIADCLYNGYYEIYTKSQLYAVRTINTPSSSGTIINRNFRLMRDIDYNEAWAPIPYLFSGIFDGNYHTIKNITVNIYGYGNFGLFDTVSGTIQNLSIENFTVNSSVENFTNYLLRVGAFAGVSSGKISNCAVYGTSNIVIPSYTNTYVGGIVGDNTGTIKDSDNLTCNINSSATMGGIVGRSSSPGQVINCSMYATLTYNYLTNNAYIGGIVGYNMNGGTVSACYYNGNIMWTSTSNAKKIGPFMGKIIGYNEGIQSYNEAPGLYNIKYYSSTNIFNKYDQSRNCFKVDNKKVGQQSSTATNKSADLTFDNYFDVSDNDIEIIWVEEIG